jgi:mono/diheme cytochrome c family protein
LIEIVKSNFLDFLVHFEEQNMSSDLNSGKNFGQDDHDKAGMKVLIFTMVFTIGFFIAIVFFSKGIDLKEINDSAQAPGAAAPGVQKVADLDMSTVKEPWVSTPEIVAHGKQLFQTSCAMCHGVEGKGDGVAGAGLNPKPRNLVEGKWKKGGTSLGLFDVLQNGIAGGSMASWKASIKKNDRWALVAFIRSITQNKVKDDEAKLSKVAPTLD